MKKPKVVLAQPALGAPSRPPLYSRAPGPVRGGGDEAAHTARLRYQVLMQDYQELAKETQAKKKRLLMEKIRKQRVLAEVKFLRKRYKSLSENPSQTIICRVRNPAMLAAARSTAWAVDAEHRSVHVFGSSSKGQPLLLRQDGPSRASPVIDLNEACEPSFEMEVENNHGYREPLSIDKAKRYRREGDAGVGPSDVRMTTYWDARNPAGGAGKRKISWQDQLALRV